MVKEAALKIALVFFFSACLTTSMPKPRKHMNGPHSMELTAQINHLKPDYSKYGLKQGPVLVWTASGLGEGYSSVTIAGGLIYTSGTNSGQTFVYCFDLNGKPVWKKPNGKAWTTTLSYASSYTGARSTPTYR